MAGARLVRLTGYCLAGIFAVVGVVFLVIPAHVLAAFNWMAEGLGWPVTTTEPHTLFLALALGYMYVVTLLAWQMARHPEVRIFPWVLAQAKGASAVICLGLFVFQEQYLLYLANFVVDGAIALLVWWLCLRAHATTAAAPASGTGAPAGDLPRAAG